VFHFTAQPQPRKLCSMERCFVVATALSLVAACGVEPAGPSSRSERLAEIGFSAGYGLLGASDTTRAPIGAALCIAYHPFQHSRIGSRSPYATGAALLGCDRVHAAGGARAPITYYATDSGFHAVVGRLLDANDEFLHTIVVAVDASQGVSDPPGGASGEAEPQISGRNGASPATVDSIRLVIEAINPTRRGVGDNLFEVGISVRGAWQIWGTRSR
jgi:hypothetical protein